MSIIKQLILLQNSKERASFTALLSKRNKRHDTRNTQLYKDILAGKDKQLLTEISPNAFNALKKRLTDLVIDFSATQTLSSALSTESKIIKNIVTSRKLITAGAIKEGMTLLKKSEQLAMRIEHHSLLNEIYHTIIEHAHKDTKIDLEELFSKLKQNNDQFIAQEKLSVLFARMHQQFISDQFHALPDSLSISLNKGLREFDIQPELILNFKSLNQLCTLSDIYGAQTKRYPELDLFFEKHISTVQGSEKDTEKVLPYHLELLYGMANIYFRKRQFDRSRIYLDDMKNQLMRYDKKLLPLWQTRYTTLEALNLNFTGQYSKAINLLNSNLDQPSVTDSEKALLKLTLCMMLFQQNQINEVKNHLLELRKTDNWYLKNMGNEWLFNYKAMEILLHFELENDLLVESKINSFKRKYGKQLKNEKDNPIWPFTSLIQSIIFNPQHINSKEFQEKAEVLIPKRGKSEDFFNVCFFAWLKAKMTQRPLYETTLKMLT